jgi:excisionase family DNA binding protein
VYISSAKIPKIYNASTLRDDGTDEEQCDIEKGVLMSERIERSLLTVPEFARALGVTTACIRRWLLERKIASVKLGRLRKIPQSEVDRLIAEGFCPAKPQPGVR